MNLSKDGPDRLVDNGTLKEGVIEPIKKEDERQNPQGHRPNGTEGKKPNGGTKPYRVEGHRRTLLEFRKVL